MRVIQTTKKKEPLIPGTIPNKHFLVREKVSFSVVSREVRKIVISEKKFVKLTSISPGSLGSERMSPRLGEVLLLLLPAGDVVQCSVKQNRISLAEAGRSCNSRVKEGTEERCCDRVFVKDC